MSRYYGPRRLTRKEVAAYGAMPASELRKLRDGVAKRNLDFDLVKQLTTIMHKRADYERAVPANNGRATIDPIAAFRCRKCPTISVGVGDLCERCGGRATIDE